MRYNSRAFFVLFLAVIVAASGCTEQNDDTQTADTAPDLAADLNSTPEPENELVFVPYQFLYDAIAGYSYKLSFCDPEPRAGPTCGGLEPATNPTGGKPPYSFYMGYGAGLLPSGMKLNLNGVLEGKPALAGDYRFEICAKDGAGNEGCNTFSLRVKEPVRLNVYWTGDGTGNLQWDTALGDATCGDTSGLGRYKCVVPLEEGSVVNITAEEEGGSIFKGWSGDCSGSGTCTILMDSDKNAVAKFEIKSKLSGTWTGSYSESSKSSVGCTYTDAGTMALTVSEAGGSITGSMNRDGVEVREVEPLTCRLMSYATDSGSVSGTISGNQVTITASLYGSYDGISRPRTFTATLGENTLSGKIIRQGAEVGSFTLQKG